MNTGLGSALRVVVRGVRRHDVADPPKRSSAADPEAGRDDQPEESAQELAVVELPDPRNQKRQHGGNTGIGKLRVRHRGGHSGRGFRQCDHEVRGAQ